MKETAIALCLPVLCVNSEAEKVEPQRQNLKRGNIFKECIYA